MTHIMIVSANGSEAKALFYLLQRAGLGAVDLSICTGEHLARLVAERGACRCDSGRSGGPGGQAGAGIG